MSERTLYDKVWDAHTVQELPNGQTQLFVGLHMIHEVTSPQAFGMLKERGYDVAFPDRTYATTDELIVIVAPIIMKTVVSSGVLVLKCDPTPREAWVEIRTISSVIAPLMV